MLNKFDKNDLPYYAGLVFMIFPFLGPFYFDYPLWTFPATLGFLIAYLLLVHLQICYIKTIEFLWLYVLLYIALLTCFVNGNMMWFFFFPANLLVWRFGKSWRSYRGISFLAFLLLVASFGVIYTSAISQRVVIALVVVFIIGMVTYQMKLREEDVLRQQLYQKTEENSQLIAENERNRIGRDLHDTLGHTFAMMSLKTELALKQLDRDNLEAVRKELLELSSISKESMKNVRELINNLKYRTVAEEIENIKQVLTLSDIELTVDNDLDLSTLSPVIQSSVIMILRELTTNIIKHAKAKACFIKFYRKENLIIEVGDDGAGFQKLTGEELHTIKERLQLVKGEVSILSSQNPTLIRVTLEEGGRS